MVNTKLTAKANWKKWLMANPLFNFNQKFKK